MRAPTIGDISFSDGMDQIRDALAQAPDAAREEVQLALDSDEMVVRIVGIVVPLMDQRFKRKYYRDVIIGVGILLLLFGLVISSVFSRINTVTRASTEQDSAIKRAQISIVSFEQQLIAANKKLVTLGLPPIPVPTNVEPGTSQQAQLSTAAATATTLASLPREIFVKPDATVLANAVAEYMKMNPIGVDPQLVINAVASYFTVNADKFRGAIGAAGAEGAQGPVGPPVTAEAIRQAFRDEMAANPNLTCWQGGSYGERTLALANGGSTQNFGCFGNDTPASSPPPPPPPVTGGGDPSAGPGAPGSSGGGGITPPLTPTTAPGASPPVSSVPPAPTTTLGTSGPPVAGP